MLTVPEVFIHSSNIGSARMALAVGVEGHKAFLKKMGLLDRLRTELPENAEPIVPARWGELNTITIAFGHGVAVAPLQAIRRRRRAGEWRQADHADVPASAIREEASRSPRRVIKPETSEAMRYLHAAQRRERGSARKAAVPGYFVGGKTGTAEKVVDGRYSQEAPVHDVHGHRAIGQAEIPVPDPHDEPQGLPETVGFATAGLERWRHDRQDHRTRRAAARGCRRDSSRRRRPSRP